MQNNYEKHSAGGNGDAKANEEAIATYEKIINEEGIECQFERLPSFLYSTKEEGRELLAQETEAAKKLGIKAHFVPGNHIKELPFGITGAVCFERQAQFEPLAFIKAIAEKLTIYENTNAVFVHGHIVATNCGTIEAKNVVVIWDVIWHGMKKKKAGIALVMVRVMI
ncbi:MAG: FAD-binding oxidoreductase, partial [Lachnospiraceae bacterium]|nr:FAD-binding oxidoreductase [Lachnospiraceae bacterium]